MKTVIVGGVAAGASTGARLRRLDESAEIVILERDHYVSFANRGLPCHIGREIPERDSLLLQTPESLAKSLALDVRTGQEVVAADAGLECASGSTALGGGEALQRPPLASDAHVGPLSAPAHDMPGPSVWVPEIGPPAVAFATQSR
jgi:hypothetical protein